STAPSLARKLPNADYAVATWPLPRRMGAKLSKLHCFSRPHPPRQPSSSSAAAPPAASTSTSRSASGNTLALEKQPRPARCKSLISNHLLAMKKKTKSSLAAAVKTPATDGPVSSRTRKAGKKGGDAAAPKPAAAATAPPPQPQGFPDIEPLLDSFDP